MEKSYFEIMSPFYSFNSIVFQYFSIVRESSDKFIF